MSTCGLKPSKHGTGTGGARQVGMTVHRSCTLPSREYITPSIARPLSRSGTTSSRIRRWRMVEASVLGRENASRFGPAAAAAGRRPEATRRRPEANASIGRWQNASQNGAKVLHAVSTSKGGSASKNVAEFAKLQYEYDYAEYEYEYAVGSWKWCSGGMAATIWHGGGVPQKTPDQRGGCW